VHEDGSRPAVYDRDWVSRAEKGSPSAVHKVQGSAEIDPIEAHGKGTEHCIAISGSQPVAWCIRSCERGVSGSCAAPHDA